MEREPRRESIGETNVISLKMSYGFGTVTCNVVLVSVIKDESNEKYIWV